MSITITRMRISSFFNHSSTIKRDDHYNIYVKTTRLDFFYNATLLIKTLAHYYGKMDIQALFIIPPLLIS